MNADELRKILGEISNGEVTVEEAMERLSNFHYTDLGFARIDNHRELRTGYPEVIYCEGKSITQVKEIFEAMVSHGNNIIATRAGKELAETVTAHFPEAHYHETARIISLTRHLITPPSAKIAVITAGTSDMAVAEEAAVTATLLGNEVIRVYDAGVAGIHRLAASLPAIRECRVAVVIAGMEGALASVVGGLVNMPVIAVPTSIGYGASFGGITALLAMMSSCAAGVTVVNIDNGFGAGFAASRINRLCEQ